MQRKLRLLFTTLILFSLAIAPVSLVNAQVERPASAPDCPSFDPVLMRDKGFSQSLPPECARTLTQNNPADKPGMAPLSSGGPDAFGYTFNDTVGYGWISATTNSGLTGDDEFTGPIDIGFNFPFYGLIQSQLYFSTNGLIIFGAGSRAYPNTIPSLKAPNNLIAPFWADLVVGSPDHGTIYYLRDTPNHRFVLEWRDVTTYGSASAFSFEAILYENGDILIQHQSLPASYNSTVGIENSLGDDGLQYQSGSSGLSAPKAILFSYPTASTARVLVSPPNAGKFSVIGGNTDFTITISNTGNRGTDTYDLTTASVWPVTLYAADGVTLLTNTNANPAVDTGPVSQGASVTVIARFSVPGSAAVGDSNSAVLTAASALDNTQTKTAHLSMTVPADFVGVFQDTTDGAMSLMTASGVTGAATYKATVDNYIGYNVAVAKLTSGNYLYTWDAGDLSAGSVWMHDIEYAVLNRNGSIVHPVTKLTNNYSAALLTEDLSPSVAVAPDGTIGLAWRRHLYDFGTSQFNDNIYFATLNGSGSLLSGPTSVTANMAWGASVDLFLTSALAASDDNRFILSWEKHDSAPAVNIWYAGRSTAGVEVFPPTALTSDNVSFGPVLNSLTGGKAILTWLTDVGEPYYAVVNSSGGITKPAASLNSGVTYRSPDAVLLSNGKVAVAWATDTGVQFAILDSSYAFETLSTEASSPALAYGEALSVTSDSSSRVIMTWIEGTTRQNLFYALGDSAGVFTTNPMSYRQSYTGSYTSINGQGNAPYPPPQIFLPLIMR